GYPLGPAGKNPAAPATVPAKTATPPNAEAGKNSPSAPGAPPAARPATPKKSGTGGTAPAPDTSAPPPAGTPAANPPDAARRALSVVTCWGERILLSGGRKGQVPRFKKWVFLAVPLAAILFQVYVPMFFPVLSFLEMPLLVVVYFAIMRRSQISGLTVGALVGLAQDSLSKNPLGMFGIVNTLLGY